MSQRYARGYYHAVAGRFADCLVDIVWKFAERNGGDVLGALMPLHLAAFAASGALEDGNVCALLSEVFSLSREGELEEVRKKLLTTGVVSESGDDIILPLVIDDKNRLYLGRYFDYERRLARALVGRARKHVAIDEPAHESRFHQALRHPMNAGIVDRQRLAVALAIRNSLTIITGGPGTGKTTTAVSIMATLLAAAPALRIALAAPTGKAAQRMQDAIRSRSASLPATIGALLPAEAFTIHRLLGVQHHSNEFRYNASNPLPYDVVVVDEASMLDLAMAAKLVEAVHPEARLVILGDKDQLAAVEAGSVFSDIGSPSFITPACREYLARAVNAPVESVLPTESDSTGPLADSVIHLTQPMRFGDGSGITDFAQAVNEGRSTDAIALLTAPDQRTLALVDDAGPRLGGTAFETIREGYSHYIEAIPASPHDPAAAFAAFDNFRVLCAVRHSPRGVEALNEDIERMFRKRASGRQAQDFDDWYDGRPVMILRTDYQLKLYNGDIGIARTDDKGNLAVYFMTSDGDYRAIAPLRLPAHATAFASTVHKAQGSEYRRVALVLPDSANRVMTRELIYTAVTRARESVAIIGTPSLLAEAISTATVRRSGLKSRLSEE